MEISILISGVLPGERWQLGRLCPRRGAKYALKKRFQLRKGIQGLIKGSFPIGGLSSRAAVLIAYVMAFAKANDIQLRPFEVVKIASEAEREYIGLNNVQLDQTIRLTAQQTKTCTHLSRGE